MPKLPVPFGEWRPDIALLDTQFASEIENVFAGSNSYLPFPSLQPFSVTSLNGGNDTYTKALLHFTGTDAGTVITDDNGGGSAHVWTASGNANTDTAAYRFSPSSLLCDGTGDYVSTPDHADFTLGTSDFTIECWVYPTVDGTQLAIAGQVDASLTPAVSPWLMQRLPAPNDNKIQVAVSDGVVFGYNLISTTPVVTGSWYHIACVRSGNTFTLYINGVAESSFTAGITLPNSASALAVGAIGDYPAFRWNGWIDEFRMSVGIARFTGNFTPPTALYFTGGPACGLYAARKADGTWKIYAGTHTRLFTWSAAGWNDVSRVAGGVYNVPTSDLWSFEQSGHYLAAVNVNDDPQYIDIESGVNFTAIPGTPPKATNIKQIGDFVFLSGLAPGSSINGMTPGAVNNRMIIWSSVNDLTAWTPGTNLCDVQEFPDCGQVQSVLGAEIGYVVQDRGIRTLQFLPGDTNFIFNFSRVLHDRGCVSKYGATAIGNVLYFVSEDGFYAMAGQQVTPIGHEKVNDWFLVNSDSSRRHVIQAISGVNKPYIVWAFYFFSGSPTYDKVLTYNWSNQRWAKTSERAYVWGLLASTNLDLDTTGTEIGDAELDSTAMSLDSFAYVGGRPLIGGIDEDGYLAAITGPNLPATLETVEAHLNPGQRSFVSAVYPVVDNAAPGNGLDPTVSVAGRERLQNPLVWSAAAPLEITGSCSILNSSRLHRFRVFVPNEAVWTHAEGVQVEVQPDGEA